MRYGEKLSPMGEVPRAKAIRDEARNHTRLNFIQHTEIMDIPLLGGAGVGCIGHFN
jgi:hypothetical protein